MRPEQLGNFLTAIFDEWVRKDVGRVFVQTFEATVRNWLRLPSSGMCVFDATCGHGLALEHNGDLYSCDHFVEPKHLLGNIRQNHMSGVGKLRSAAHSLAAVSWKPSPVIAGNARWGLPVRVNVPRIGFSPRRMGNRG